MLGSYQIVPLMFMYFLDSFFSYKANNWEEYISVLNLLFKFSEIFHVWGKIGTYTSHFTLLYIKHN